MHLVVKINSSTSEVCVTRGCVRGDRVLGNRTMELARFVWKMYSITITHRNWRSSECLNNLLCSFVTCKNTLLFPFTAVYQVIEMTPK